MNCIYAIIRREQSGNSFKIRCTTRIVLPYLRYFPSFANFHLSFVIFSSVQFKCAIKIMF